MWRFVVDSRVHFTLSGRSPCNGCAQVDTASLADMHGEADKTEKQKARGFCVGAGVDICRWSARAKSVRGSAASRDLCGA